MRLSISYPRKGLPPVSLAFSVVSATPEGSTVSLATENEEQFESHPSQVQDEWEACVPD